MILVQAGHRAWNSQEWKKKKQETMRGVRMWCWRILGVLLIALTVSGCPKQQQPASESEFGGPGGQGLGPGGIQDGNLASRDPRKRTDDRIQNPGSDTGGPLTDVHFDYDAFDLSTEARETLQSHADWLKKNAGAKVEIEGHCDERGTVEYNLALIIL
jgi:outer membrane protein OmpA-like peptidoglycan-associated protein